MMNSKTKKILKILKKKMNVRCCSEDGCFGFEYIVEVSSFGCSEFVGNIADLMLLSSDAPSPSEAWPSSD